VAGSGKFQRRCSWVRLASNAIYLGREQFEIFALGFGGVGRHPVCGGRDPKFLLPSLFTFG